MKNSGIVIPLIITALFISFTAGLYVGRNYNHSEIQTTRFFSNEPALADVVPVELEVSDAPVNINTAGMDELCTLPGIGEILAKRIIEYREANGPFPYPEALLDVEGMGKQTLENILDMITVGG